MEETSKINECDKKQRRSCDGESPSNAAQDESSKIYWTFLEHAGPAFPPPYERLPEDVNFKYDGINVKLSDDAEEAAVLHAMKQNYEHASKEQFKNNFIKSWHKVMKPHEKKLIRTLSKCDFDEIKRYLENKKQDEAAIETESNASKEIEEKYGYCIINGNRVKIGNYKIEKPDIFCPKGDNPLMGKLKKRILPSDVTINCSKDSKIHEPSQWKEVVHRPNRSYLAFWMDELQNKRKYIRLDESSDQEQESDKEKFDTAKELHKHIGSIQDRYRNDWKADNLESRERGVALYFLDTLAFRAGNVKETNSTGCCTLKVSSLQLCGNNVVHFDFIGKSAVRYNRDVTVEEPVYNNLKLFIKSPKSRLGGDPLPEQPATIEESEDNNVESLIKNLNLNDGEDPPVNQPMTDEEPVCINLELFKKTSKRKTGDDLLFDQLTLTKLNNYLKDLNLIPNFTAKVFRTYRACATFEENLEKETPQHGTQQEKIIAFNKANLEVAKLCNHKNVRSSLPPRTSTSDEDKQYKLLSSKSDYIDPRIVIAWCKRNNIPIGSCYSKELREKFQWAIEEIGDNEIDYVFCQN